MYTPLLRLVTVMVTGAAEAVDVTLVPPAPFTVTVPLRLRVHEEVDPDVGAPKVTFGFAPVVGPLTVLALAPGVYVQLYVLL
jgi:hypothetical protein